MGMTEQATYKNINATVRPPRCAIFINRKSQHWKAAASVAMIQASQVWGGRHFLLVPTDGNEIEEKFWELLEAYSPDYLALCHTTFADLEDADPERYQETKQGYQEDWLAKGMPADDFDEWFTGSAKESRLDELTISDALDKELVYRLAPLHHGSAVNQRLTSSSGFGYPFTKMSQIIGTTTRHIGQMVLPPKLPDSSDLSLLIHSQTGLASEDYREALEEQDFATCTVAENHALRLIRSMFDGHQRPIHDENDVLLEKYASSSPFGISMLHLGTYYAVNRHLEYKEPIVVVLGDSVDDFCLYYSLSRVHEGVLWLPCVWLSAYVSGVEQLRKLREEGEALPSLSVKQTAARELTDIAFALTNYGHSEKRIQLCSASLGAPELADCREQMARALVGDSDQFMAVTDCVSIEAVSTSCTSRVFEVDNYANNRPAVFIDGKSVSPVETPKPKSFSEIVLPGHYWMTSLQIEGYQPPSLPALGPKIIHSPTTECRVASDGLVYICPNSLILSRDLDALLVRPEIEMPDVMTLFDTYFEEVGVSVGYSDKGNYFNDTVRRFGSLDALGQFIKAAATRSVLDKFMQQKGKTDNGVFYLPNDQRSYLNLDAFESSVGNGQAAADLVDDLVGKDVIRRGYILRCERCRQQSWYSLDVLTSTFVCGRCSFRQQFTQSHWKNGLVEPHWCYRLAETVYQFYHKNSHLTAQVLYKLKSESRTAFHYAPEIDLIGFPNLGGDQREMDVACILDGEIVFGECKTESLKVKDVEKFETLVDMPIKNPARIVFATTRGVSAEVKARISILPNAEIFTRSDLYDD